VIGTYGDDEAATLDRLADLGDQAHDLAFALRASWAGIDGGEVTLLDRYLCSLDEANSALHELRHLDGRRR
jgi:hypothetical protein